MKQNFTELVFILDRSGSMSGLEGDTIGGFNGMLERQKKEPGEAVVTTVLFDDQYELLHDRIPLQAVRPMTDRQYFVRGCTALLDAIGRTVNKVANVHRGMAEEYRPERVMFVIITDGFENASREYNWDKVKSMVEHYKAKYHWEFLFLGANLDAIGTAARFGISADRAVQYHSDHIGTQVNYQAVSQAVSDFREGQLAPSGTSQGRAWKRRIEADFQSRKKGQ
ncbi:MAG: hypothetical protein SO073_04845 [Candidatus Onthomonas sp.]|nr:hypothetical protein [Candidatus Onthomonas sp.]